MQQVFQKTLKDTMYYKNIPALIYEINYPFFITTCNSKAGSKINEHYSNTATKLENYCRTVLFKQAEETVKYIQDNRLFNSYKMNVDFKTTYNNECIVSLYTETLIYLGGAHEETKRTSDTWDFNTGNKLYLGDIIPTNTSTLENLYFTVEQQITDRLKISPGSYFDDYKIRLRNTFNSEHYYLLPGYLVIYYQQYEISPYFTGLPEFYFPYSF